MARVSGKGVSVGTKIKVNFLKQGFKQDKSIWQLFVYQESKKNPETGEYDELGRYTIFINNPNQNLQNGDMVTIKSITKALVEKNYYNNREYTNLNLWCEVEYNAPYTPRLVDNQNQQLNNNFEMQTPSFADEYGISEDDLPF